MIRTAIGELGCRDIQDALPCPLRDLMDKAEQVLVRIAEAHATANSGLKIRSAAGHIECHHALIRVPNIDHAVKAGIAGTDLVLAQEIIPLGP